MEVAPQLAQRQAGRLLRLELEIERSLVLRRADEHPGDPADDQTQDRHRHDQLHEHEAALIAQAAREPTCGAHARGIVRFDVRRSEISEDSSHFLLLLTVGRKAGTRKPETGYARKIPRPRQRAAALKRAETPADRYDVTLELTPRARLLLVVALVLALAGAGLMAYTRLHKSKSSSPPQVTHTTKPRPTTSKAAVTPRHSVARPKAKPRAKVAPKPTPKPKPKPATPAPADQLPAAIRRALAANQIVVVSLYDPKAKIDGTALREARAGAQLAGSSFVPIDVRKHAVDSLNAKYGVTQDPALLVLKPPDDLVVRIDGFADRDTVAQAAVEAAGS
jgi:hypothetical protein